MVWTAPKITRTLGFLDASTGSERTLLDAWLEHHRQTLLWKCEGLTAEQLKLRPVEPSNLSLLGLVRHMAEVERDWFRTRFAGERVGYLYCSDDDLDAEADYAAYLRELGIVRQTVAERSLEEVYFDPRRKTHMNLRWVYHSMIQEYARHNGHADLLRERIDGRTGQ